MADVDTMSVAELKAGLLRARCVDILSACGRLRELPPAAACNIVGATLAPSRIRCCRRIRHDHCVEKQDLVGLVRGRDTVFLCVSAALRPKTDAFACGAAVQGAARDGRAAGVGQAVAAADTGGGCTSGGITACRACPSTGQRVLLSMGPLRRCSTPAAPRCAPSAARPTAVLLVSCFRPCQSPGAEPVAVAARRLPGARTSTASTRPRRPARWLHSSRRST